MKARRGNLPLRAFIFAIIIPSQVRSTEGNSQEKRERSDTTLKCCGIRQPSRLCSDILFPLGKSLPPVGTFPMVILARISYNGLNGESHIRAGEYLGFTRQIRRVRRKRVCLGACALKHTLFR